jgi:hypothetical protein
VEVVPVTRFAASFGDSYLTARDAIPIAELRKACHRWNGQLAIQAIQIEQLSPRIDQLPGFASRILGRAPRPVLGAEEAVASQEESYFPTDDDTRSLALRLVRDRRGQAAFRKALVERYGMQCLISGCSLLDLLEAAHIKPFRGLDDHHTSNGLLLRADLHTLYDLDLIGIEPQTLTIHINPAAAHAGYDVLVGTTLRCGSLRPSRAALELRWFEFLARMPRPRG